MQVAKFQDGKKKRRKKDSEGVRSVHLRLATCGHFAVLELASCDLDRWALQDLNLGPSPHKPLRVRVPPFVPLSSVVTTAGRQSADRDRGAAGRCGTGTEE